LQGGGRRRAQSDADAHAAQAQSPLAARHAAVRAVLGRMPAYVPGGSFALADALWALLDAAVDLGGCAVFSYVPKDDSDPLLTGALWSMNFFFVNKARKQLVFFFVKARARTRVDSPLPSGSPDAKSSDE
jgi:hypothetical protein